MNTNETLIVNQTDASEFVVFIDEHLDDGSTFKVNAQRASDAAVYAYMKHIKAVETEDLFDLLSIDIKMTEEKLENGTSRFAWDDFEGFHEILVVKR